MRPSVVACSKGAPIPVARYTADNLTAGLSSADGFRGHPCRNNTLYLGPTIRSNGCRFAAVVSAIGVTVLAELSCDLPRFVILPTAFTSSCELSVRMKARVLIEGNLVGGVLATEYVSAAATVMAPFEGRERNRAAGEITCDS